MNWLEALYPSPAFPNPVRGAPGVGSTPYFAAYTCVHGSYSPLKGRIEAGEPASGQDPVVMDLLRRVEVVGHRDRPAFAPRITVRARDGTTYPDEFRGDELGWNLAAEIRRISSLFDDLPWPRDQLEGIVQRVSRLEEEARVDSLIRLCVRQ
jgi:hypothetical protein